MFPVNLRLTGRLVLMVGAGRVGGRKLRKILAAGARVRLVEPEPSPEIAELAAAGALELEAGFKPELMNGVSLVFTASSDRALNQAVAEAARRAGAWVNAADDPEGSDFQLPAVVERGDFLLTVATGGGSPALTAAVAAGLREVYGPEYGRLARLLAWLRPLVLNSGRSGLEREAIFKRLAESAELRAALAGENFATARELTAELLTPIALEDDEVVFQQMLK